MALPKLFQRIFWHNNTTPAINEDNLNAMSKAIDDIDNRVIVLGDDVITVIPQIQAYLEQAEDLVEAMELLSQNPPYIGQNGNWWVWDTNTSAFVDSGVDASISVNIADITMLAPDATPYVTNTGTDTDPIFHLFIPRGQTGNGISTISKTGTSGLVDTYTITMTDGTTSTFTVTNGAGDMNKSVYDPTNAIANAGGMKSAAAKNSTNAVTSGSTALVESGAVYSSEQDIYEVMGQNGAKNAFPLDLEAIKNTSGNTSGTWSGDAYTINGITYTFNGDGTITGNGTASANARIMLISDNGGGKSPCFLKPNTDYILSCENIMSIGGNNAGAILGINEWDGTQYVSSPTVGDYTGVNELEFTTKSSAIAKSMRALLEVKNRVTLNNFVFKPMVRDARDIDPTYQPYAMTNRKLTEELKNRLPLLIDSGTIPANSSKTISITNSSSALYRLTLGSIGADGCGRIVILGKHPSVANIKYATFDCVDIEASYVATVSVSGNTLTITSATNSNCMYTLEKIRA